MKKKNDNIFLDPDFWGAIIVLIFLIFGAWNLIFWTFSGSQTHDPYASYKDYE